MITDSIYNVGQFVVKTFSIKQSYFLAEKAALLRYYVSLRDKKIIADNLKTILRAKGESFDEEKIKKLIKKVYINFGKYLVEFFSFSKIDKKFIAEKVKIRGLEIIEEIVKESGGVILLSAHIGNWELGAAVISALGYPVSALTLEHRTRSVNEFFNRKRISNGISVIHTGMAVKGCFQALKDKRILASIGDKDYSGNGRKMRFFGKNTFMPKGSAVFSYRTQSPIVPVFLIREPDNTFILSFKEPIKPNLSRYEEAEVPILMRKTIDIIEEEIEKYPTQWLMFHKIWAA
ncbi:MAG: lysophospholipid acyltransferase family protein [Candidatus Omnitrophica bacterium]|nr:lysophospholipid acyltransferase family protein [Candidatus Omnitrophota bacterium]